MTPPRWDVRRRDRADRSHPLPGHGPDVILDNIRSAFNVGSIFRTCDAAGVRHLYLAGITALPPNPRLLKASLGAEAMVSWSHELSTIGVVESLRARGIKIVSVELTGRSRPFTEVEYPAQTAFVFCHEVAGVSVPILDASDEVIEIPMLGKKNSLNVATSVGIVLFEWVRRRLSPPTESGAAPAP